MASFPSFLITKKFPSPKTLKQLLSGPLTGLSALFYGVFFAICVILFILLVTINNHFLITVPARGGNLTEGVIGTPHFINPLLATTETDRRLVSLVYANLSDITDSYTFSPDGKEVTVLLKPNLKFDDGKPLTSNDVTFTVQKMQDVTISNVSGYWENIAVENPDSQTVVFMLPNADTSFISRMSFYILPKHIWEPITDDAFETAKQNLHPVGAGAFKVASVAYTNDLPSTVVLKRNSYALGAKALLKTLTIATYANQSDLFNAVSAEDVDFTYSLAPETLATSTLPSSLNISSVPTTSTINLYHSSTDTALSNPLTVSAISQAIDKQAIIDTVVYGYGTPSGVLQNPATAGTAAKKTSINGFSIAVQNDPQLLLVAQTFAKQLQAAGVNVSVKAFDPGAFQRAAAAGTFAVFLARSSDTAIPRQYSIALPLYTEALPYVFNTTTHTVISNALESPATEYEDAKDWYTHTDKLWKWFRNNQNGK
ncbi:MAG: family 5 extracellular solute-binding protein peptide/nickel transport system substrate-binding [Candidatus Nomurabacteria bacterium]|nr:family 5 extracellular solute-binding protein peptide/nickel transport system substrate-binding [Candidatus Nomurabacteria bacterium]